MDCYVYLKGLRQSGCKRTAVYYCENCNKNYCDSCITYSDSKCYCGFDFFQNYLVLLEYFDINQTELAKTYRRKFLSCEQAEKYRDAVIRNSNNIRQNKKTWNQMLQYFKIERRSKN